MYNKNIIKNRNKLLLHDLITKAPNYTFIKKTNENYQYKKLELSLEVLEIASNLDYKQYKGASILSKEISVKNNAKSELLLTLIMLEKITGLLPKLIKAKKSVAGFNIRAGMDIGARVTLRKKFLERLYQTLNMIIAPSTT
jgi:ribosomal protein L5